MRSDRAPRVLIAQEDAAARERLGGTLGRDGFRVLEAASASEVLARITEHEPDLVVLGGRLRRQSAVAVTTRIRSRSAAPIVIVAAPDDGLDEVAALVAGANDYVDAAIEPADLLERVVVWLRHATRVGSRANVAVLELGDLKADFARRRAYLRGSEVALTDLQFKLFAAMIRSGGRLVTRDQLAAAVWGPSRSERALYVRIVMWELRKRFERDSRPCPYFVAVGRSGYRLCVDGA